MPQLTSKKKIVFFLIIFFFFLSTLNNKNAINYTSNLFKIDIVEIKGLEKETYESIIKEETKYLINKNLIFLDKYKLIKKLNSFNFLENFSVFKDYPNKIIINLKVTDLIAISYKNGQPFYIGSNGKTISYNKMIDNNYLPKVYGNFKSEKLANFFNLLEKNFIEISNIDTIYYFDSDRWDLKLKSNTLIKLPITELDKAIIFAKKIIEDNQFNEKIIDLRVANQVIISNE